MFFVSALLLSAATASAQNYDRHCVAILLRDGVQSQKCLAADNSLNELTDEAWNTLVCSDQPFTKGGRIYQRNAQTGNLWYDECTWEVRGHSG
jgi:hypothetical protein